MKKNVACTSRRAFIGAAAAAMAMGALAAAGCSNSTSSTSSSSSTTSDEKTEDAASEDKLPCGNVKTDKGYYLIYDGKLTVGSDCDYPPMTYLDSDGNAAGFEIELMREICSRIGLELNYLEPQNWDTLLTQVATGNTIDVSVSTTTITDEREEMVDFSDSYFESNQALVIMKGAYTDKSELNDESITAAAQSGTSGEDWIKENLPKATYVPYTFTTDAVTALVAGQCQVVVYDEANAEGHINGSFPDCEILEVIPTGELYGMAFNEANDALREDVNAALAAIKEDGTYDKLYEECVTNYAG